MTKEEATTIVYAVAHYLKSPDWTREDFRNYLKSKLEITDSSVDELFKCMKM